MFAPWVAAGRSATPILPLLLQAASSSTSAARQAPPLSATLSATLHSPHIGSLAPTALALLPSCMLCTARSTHGSESPSTTHQSQCDALSSAALDRLHPAPPGWRATPDRVPDRRAVALPLQRFPWPPAHEMQMSPHS